MNTDPTRRALMQLHLTVGEKQRVYAAAKQWQMSPSMWIRFAIAEQLKRPKPKDLKIKAVGSY